MPSNPPPCLESYPYLDHVLGAYLNSDYTIYGADPEDAVAAYARDEDWLDVVAVRADIRRFLAFHHNDLDAELVRRFPDHARDAATSALDFLKWLDATLASCHGGPKS